MTHPMRKCLHSYCIIFTIWSRFLYVIMTDKTTCVVNTFLYYYLVLEFEGLILQNKLLFATIGLIICQVLFPSVIAMSPTTPLTESDYNEAITLSITNANLTIDEAIQQYRIIIQLKHWLYQNYVLIC